MASSSKPTAVHFSLIVFVMLSLILGVVTYLNVRDLKIAQQDLNSKTQELSEANSALSNKIADEDATKKALGYNFAEMGADNPGPNTVIGALVEDLQAKGVSGEPVVATQIAAMRSELDQKNSDLAAKEEALKQLQDRLLALETQYRGEKQQIVDSQTSSERNLQNLIGEHDERVRQKDQTINQLRGDVNRLQVESNQAREDMARLERDKNDEIGNLTNINSVLRQQLDDIRRVSFEKPDGTIRSVDNTTRNVWINLGSRDNLQPQTTFSVYDQQNYGVGRGQEDIKAQVEVTRILGPDLSEARIIDEDLYRPIAVGDVVYSPVWTAGLKEQFAFVGIIDIDGDGQSDRALMHDILENQGASVFVEVNEDGDRVPEDATIDVGTKFLVIGHIPDPADYAAADDELVKVKKMLDQRAQLEKEALQHGVRIVRLNDFLGYMGYRPQQRLFLPGSDAPYQLKAGTRATAVEDRASTGTTSELFRQNRARSQQTSSGQTSKLFGN